MNKIKVYDIKKLIESSSFGSDKYTTYGTDNKLAIIEGTKAVFILDQDGCGTLHKSLNDEMEIQLRKVREDNCFNVMPDSIIKCSIKEVISDTTYEEVEIKDFVRKFGSRLESNFKIALRTLNEIGLDAKDYYDGGR